MMAHGMCITLYNVSNIFYWKRVCDFQVRTSALKSQVWNVSCEEVVGEKLGRSTRQRNAWGRGCPVTRVRPRGRRCAAPRGRRRHSQAPSARGKETAAVVLEEEEAIWQSAVTR